jgi:hypothetical protein
MKKVNGVNHSMQLKVVSHRKNVIARLENQLKSGVKTTRDGIKKLSEKDIMRINSEITILKSRI